MIGKIKKLWTRNVSSKRFTNVRHYGISSFLWVNELWQKKMLWDEIFVSVNGIFTDFLTMKKKWKSLSDSFRIYNNKQYQPSGSAGKRKCNWVHFEQMQFLNDVQLDTETTTNISIENTAEESDCSIIDSNSSGRQSRHNKRCLSDSGEGSLDRLSEALREPITVNLPPFILPVSPPLDKSALFGNLIAAQLRDVDPNFLDDTMLQIMQLVNNAKRRKQ